ncbi:glycoside hydrolase family 88/105 protein [Enterococcus timonensis]|uniref:glycoside hydrolase family 88/105 protein n=1 Tax=Enterococcus timonensis TaxID=1852364 RepID=UPI0008D92E84|nr:glycoside hydrolase family 88 protein [Enterococcus timonensis]
MYFNPANSAQYNYNSQTKPILKSLIQRFIGSNPEIPYNPVVDFPDQYPYNRKGWCKVSMEKEFDYLEVGKKVAAYTNWTAENDREATLILECYGPTTVFVDKVQVFVSNPSQENCRTENAIPILLKKGWNQLVIITEKTPLGFGFSIRSDKPQWDPTHFYRNADYFLPMLGFNCSEFSGNLSLENFVEPSWIEEKEEISSKAEETYLVKIAITDANQVLTYRGNGKLYFNDGTQILNEKAIQITHNDGWLDLIYKGTALSEDLAKISGPSNIENNWLYCGPVSSSENFVTDFKTIQLSPDREKIYWRVPIKGAYIRLARNAPLFAHWTYWMGVTLYGLLEASDFFDEVSWKEYALASVKQITDYDQYGQWDKEKYNYTIINTQFYWLDELDDCGSFGNLMLESLNYQKNESAILIAERIADFMEAGVLRQPDGAFYRSNETMWVDDLYMSTPFLVRYWELTRNEQYLNDAIKQFYFFKERFFLEEKQIMSHIFDTRFKKANNIPWSRGNGWVIFSLSELLNKLPEDHVERPKLVKFYNQLVTGLLAQQDEKGLWHQIIDDETTYSESSCSAMFICALSRGIRNGYLDEELIEISTKAIQRAWKGLITYCIDKNGNLYGVCRGSGFSFSRDYYKSLGWLLNDAHGIGIVALAGVEYEKVIQFVTDKS